VNGLIYLVGLSGSGKTTVGRLLATRLQLPFVDTDALIERRAGKTISEIFASDGEPAFREMESTVLRDVASTPAVVSTGGGLPIDPGNRDLMRQTGAGFWLDATTEALEQRLEGEASKRPLLNGTLSETIDQLREARRSSYADAGARIDTSGRSPAQVVDLVAQQLRNLNQSKPWSQDPVPPVWIDTSAHSYGVYVGSQAFERLPELLVRHGLDGRLLVIADETVWRLHQDRIEGVLGERSHVVSLVPAGEQHKTLQQASRLYDELLAQRPERGDLIVALGGGVIGDLAGFVAATLLRGIRFIQVPTTVLSQVDSSVGGKVAVDHPRGKNLIGAFHQPNLVLADLEFLGTLPAREIPAGLAEIVKIAVMQDRNLFDRLEADSSALLSTTGAPLGAAIRRAIELKATLVEQDERDLTGARALLNYGHTLGQALEAATGYGRFLHGEAIAVGMGAAARMASWMGLHPPDEVRRQDELLAALGLPASAPDTDPGDIRAALGLDKKREGGQVKWVLPVGIGRGRSGCVVPDGMVERAIDWIVEGED
jgi:shikimate kinase / 3-dehydroquinate synthase